MRNTSQIRKMCKIGKSSASQSHDAPRTLPRIRSPTTKNHLVHGLGSRVQGPGFRVKNHLPPLPHFKRDTYI